MPNTAFEDGYQREILQIESGYQNTNKMRDVSYFLRTRAQEIDDRECIFNYSKFKDVFDF